MAGARPATIMYEVMVRLTCPTVTSSARARSSMAGKKMKDERGEKVAAKEATQRISLIWFLGKAEYAGGGTGCGAGVLTEPVAVSVAAWVVFVISGPRGTGE